ncbi:MAG: hypothetical protein ABR562_03155 [Thermoplasmatota archaeon]|nr:cupredoxin domain-containing protein [Halobacteriales archaeon]
MAEAKAKPARKSAAQRAAKAPADEPKRRRIPEWLKGWSGLAIAVALLAFVGYGVYCLVVSISNGNMAEMRVHVGTTSTGMYLHCGAGSSPGVCDGDPSVFHVGVRDRVHVTIVNDDGGDHTHDIRLQGGPYWLWPAGFEDELRDCAPMGSTEPCADTYFTAWSAGSFEIVCEIPGHYEGGMRGTLVVS